MADRAASRRRRGASLLAPAMLMLASCGSGSASPPPSSSARGLPLADLTFLRGSHALLHLTVELAETSATRERGLMGVRSLAHDGGEAFVFDTQVDDGFWMKDTVIPLDIAFVDGRNRVVDVQTMQPCTADPCTVYNAARLYTTAVEVAAGVFTGTGLRSGDIMTLTRRPPSANTAAP